MSNQGALSATKIWANFTGDTDVEGPSTIAGWKAALTVAKRVLGLPNSHRLSRYVAEVFVDVSEAANAA